MSTSGAASIPSTDTWTCAVSVYPARLHRRPPWAIVQPRTISLLTGQCDEQASDRVALEHTLTTLFASAHGRRGTNGAMMTDVTEVIFGRRYGRCRAIHPVARANETMRVALVAGCGAAHPPLKGNRKMLHGALVFSHLTVPYDASWRGAVAEPRRRARCVGDRVAACACRDKPNGCSRRTSGHRCKLPATHAASLDHHSDPPVQRSGPWC